MSITDTQQDDELDVLRRKSVVPLESTDPTVTTGKTITSLSAQTIKEQFPHLIVRLSPKRQGISIENALAIAEGRAYRRSA